MAEGTRRAEDGDTQGTDSIRSHGSNWTERRERRSRLRSVRPQLRHSITPRREHPGADMTDISVYYEQISDQIINKLPPVKMTCEKLRFVVDTGAAYSVIQSKSLPDTRMSGRSLYSLGASGVHVRETLSVPLQGEFENHTFKHAFLVSRTCPLNLIGRDLILAPGLNLISTPKSSSVRVLHLFRC